MIYCIEFLHKSFGTDYNIAQNFLSATTICIVCKALVPPQGFRKILVPPFFPLPQTWKIGSLHLHSKFYNTIWALNLKNYCRMCRYHFLLLSKCCMYNMFPKRMCLLLPWENFMLICYWKSPFLPSFIHKFYLKSLVPPFHFENLSSPFWFLPPQIFFQVPSPFWNFQNFGSPFWKEGNTLCTCQQYVSNKRYESVSAILEHTLLSGQPLQILSSSPGIAQNITE